MSNPDAFTPTDRVILHMVECGLAPAPWQMDWLARLNGDTLRDVE